MTKLFGLLGFASLAAAACISSGDETTINNALKSGGASAVVQLCPGAVITVHNTVAFTAANQELSTQGYPTGSTRAIIRLQATDQSISAVIRGGSLSGIKLRNIQIDGDRSGNGQITAQASSANIELGGIQSGLLVDHVASMNPRGWSCMHIGEGGAASGASACSNATITNNDIGPCGLEGHDAAGHGRWADGISFACTNSLVQSNTVTGSTDGGIVLFSAPGTKVLSNKVISSTTNAGFGAINLVDNLAVYNGSFANVEVSSNTIQGQRLFGAGIAIGSCVWTTCSASTTTPKLSGPVTIANNVFSGSIAFPIPISGWTGGITVTGNTVTGVGSNSAFSEAGNCPAATKTAFNANQHLVWNSPSVTGPTSLQSGFVQHTDYPSFFICPTPPLPSTQVWTNGTLNVNTVPTTFSTLHNGFNFVFDDSAHLIVYDNGVVATTIGSTTTCNGQCTLDFQGDGNLVKRLGGSAFWASGTANKGSTLTSLNTSPWLEIKDKTGAVIWDGVNGAH
ncbi:hypothetical protein TGAMA5MH_01169 [Trichoderma gamsii]|uniref:Bulb-type lectin domain-containing protein n=1 Tax=Trichoderma gamsii TaxID=398673 RepID=A0A2K0TPB2_9HYPO|nr:hypothetical protein TGAMA5MH_01169 [Trichoderma gamsii]